LIVYDSYTDVFIVSFPCIYVSSPELIHQHLNYPSIHIPLFMVTSTCFNVPYSYLYRNCINHIYPLYFFIYPPLPTSVTWAVLQSCPLFKHLFIVQWEFCLGILSVNILCLGQSDPLPLLFLNFILLSSFVQQFLVVSLCLVPMQMWCILLNSLSICVSIFHA
jgi:hypothetical protein